MQCTLPAGFFQMVPGMMGAVGGPLLDSFRSGLGFDYDAIGEDTLCGLCRCGNCMF